MAAFLNKDIFNSDTIIEKITRDRLTTQNKKPTYRGGDTGNYNNYYYYGMGSFISNDGYFFVTETTLTLLQRINADLAKGKKKTVDGVTTFGSIFYDYKFINNGECGNYSRNNWYGLTVDEYNDLQHDQFCLFNTINVIFKGTSPYPYRFSTAEKNRMWELLIENNIVTESEKNQIIASTKYISNLNYSNWSWVYDETTGVDTATLQSGLNFTWRPAYNPNNEQVYMLKFQTTKYNDNRGYTPNMSHSTRSPFYKNIYMDDKGSTIEYDICQSVTNHELNQTVPQFMWSAWSVGEVGSNSDIEFDHMDFTRIDEGLSLAIKRPGNIVVNSQI